MLIQLYIGKNGFSGTAGMTGLLRDLESPNEILTSANSKTNKML